MKKCFAWVVLLLLLASAFPAGAEVTWDGNWVIVPGEASVRLPKPEKYTFVTRDNLEENMALCLARGNSEADVRRRFANEAVVWEAYRKDLPGCFRMEIYEDEWTHYVWDEYTMGDMDFHDLPKALMEADWLGDRYYLFSLDELLTYRFIVGRMLSVLPYEYESGVFSLHFYNGKGYMFLYCKTEPASRKELWPLEDYEIIWDTCYQKNNGFKRLNSALAHSTAMTDLLPDRSGLILNLHEGPFEINGKTEKNALVTAQWGSQTESMQVEGKEYKGKVQLTEGENTIILRAEKPERQENSVELTFPVNSSMAALALEEFPYLTCDRDKLRVKGSTDPRGSVKIILDEGEEEAVTVKEDGSFAYSFTASDWEEHQLDIIASQEGLEDCQARFTFTPTYEEAEKGVRAYRKTLDEDFLPRHLGEDPESCVGKRVKLETMVRGLSMRDGILTVEARFTWTKGGNYNTAPCYLIFDSYMEDYFKPGLDVTVYGEIIEPARTDPVCPRIKVQYVEYVYGRGW